MRVILQSKAHSINSHQMKITPPIGFNCKAIYLTSVSIPLSFYNVRETNNELFVNGVLKTIPPQNYNSIQLAKALQVLLPEGAIVIFNRQKLKYQITNTGDAFNLRFSTSYNLFGFHRITEAFSVNEFQESDFVADINDGIHSIIISANFGNTFSCLFNEVFGTQIIARIPIENRRPGEMINYNDENNQRPVASNIKSLQYFEISILDDDLNPLQLNGVDYQVEFFIDLENKLTEDTIRKTVTRGITDEKNIKK